MSDRIGLVTLPIAAPFGSPLTTAVGDPALDVLGAFLKAALNRDTKAAWAVVHPGIVPPAAEPLPVGFVHTHNPDDGEFTENKLPAIFVWRSKFPKLSSYTQEWEAANSTIFVLWVPPPASYEQTRIREPFKNLLAKSLQLNLARKRNPAWIVTGDTEEKAAVYGSFLTHHMRVARMQLLEVGPFPLVVQRAQRNDPYDALLATIEVLEVSTPLLDDYLAFDHIEGTMRLRDYDADGLAILTYTWKPTLTSVYPVSGPAAGGTAITLYGSQFFEDDDVGDLTVTVGGVACTSVVLVEETTITAVTPAGAAGAKSVVVTLPNGATATLAGGFTHT